MTTTASRTVKLDIASRLDLLEMVQVVLTHLTQQLQFDDDASHYMSVAVRESVVNAIKHGNGLDESRRVALAFTVHADALEVEVRDEGRGFDPKIIPDPLAPENLLKAEGRGIFFMRSFMDSVDYTFPAKGGTVVRMMKKRAPAS